jgi:hypothetical protein
MFRYFKKIPTPLPYHLYIFQVELQTTKINLAAETLKNTQLQGHATARHEAAVNLAHSNKTKLHDMNNLNKALQDSNDSLQVSDLRSGHKSTPPNTCKLTLPQKEKLALTNQLETAFGTIEHMKTNLKGEVDKMAENFTTVKKDVADCKLAMSKQAPSNEPSAGNSGKVNLDKEPAVDNSKGKGSADAPSGEPPTTRKTKAGKKPAIDKEKEKKDVASNRNAMFGGARTHVKLDMHQGKPKQDILDCLERKHKPAEWVGCRRYQFSPRNNVTHIPVLFF